MTIKLYSLHYMSSEDCRLQVALLDGFVCMLACVHCVCIVCKYVCYFINSLSKYTTTYILTLACFTVTVSQALRFLMEIRTISHHFIT